MARALRPHLPEPGRSAVTQRGRHHPWGPHTLHRPAGQALVLAGRLLYPQWPLREGVWAHSPTRAWHLEDAWDTHVRRLHTESPCTHLLSWKPAGKYIHLMSARPGFSVAMWPAPTKHGYLHLKNPECDSCTLTNQVLSRWLIRGSLPRCWCC